MVGDSCSGGDRKQEGRERCTARVTDGRSVKAQQARERNFDAAKKVVSAETLGSLKPASFSQFLPVFVMRSRA